ncbi:hypothetical protein BJ165DRAFT_430410 [Panaeolus papilionaceus]|nr:hypothetical protein BJ165DRAFT_430410 [Panaeolus papilionaceus]
MMWTEQTLMGSQDCVHNQSNDFLEEGSPEMCKILQKPESARRLILPSQIPTLIVAAEYLVYFSGSITFFSPKNSRTNNTSNSSSHSYAMKFFSSLVLLVQFAMLGSIAQAAFPSDDFLSFTTRELVQELQARLDIAAPHLSGRHTRRSLAYDELVQFSARGGGKTSGGAGADTTVTPDATTAAVDGGGAVTPVDSTQDTTGGGGGATTGGTGQDTTQGGGGAGGKGSHGHHSHHRGGSKLAKLRAIVGLAGHK